MFSFFFGSSDKKLYGSLESTDGGRGVLICGSWGPEAQASHRFLRVLSKRLVAAGSSTMRFDYYGTGDSYGESRDTTIASMISDTEMAIEEFRESQRIRHLTIVGYRLGALPALSTMEDSRFDLILVDPVLDGNAWLRSLETDIWAGELPGGELETGGFVMGAELRKSLKGDLTAGIDLTSVRTNIVTDGSEAHPDLRSRTIRCESSPTWRLDEGVGSATIPPELVDLLVTEACKGDHAAI